MATLAAIEGQLVSIKNVSTHKSACLTIHVPEEYALKVIEAFGWPTMVAPVHVAIARLDPTAKPEKPRGGKLAQRAGILSNEKSFQKYVEVETPEEAAEWVRAGCHVTSRSELDHNPEAAARFRDLELSYNAWKLAT